MLAGIELDDLECRGAWWSLAPESKEEVAARLHELIAQVRYHPAEVVVLVGHSHLIRELMRKELRPAWAEAHADLAADLYQRKLANCGVARLDLLFDAERPCIADVRLVGGTTTVA